MRREERTNLLLFAVHESGGHLSGAPSSVDGAECPRVAAAQVGIYAAQVVRYGGDGRRVGLSPGGGIAEDVIVGIVGDCGKLSSHLRPEAGHISASH